ncbi:hypothetical protein [Dethiobacter alkaliphilus]|nr:hypothetical protein [Dethiobacter alkaliphilus]MCW3491164.1 hypothetical protein [Dethiobacter alkaliphilus]
MDYSKRLKQGFMFGLGFWTAGLVIGLPPILVIYFVARAVLLHML